MTAAPTSNNFDQAELDKFAALANRWWDADGPQKPLHALNPVRLRYVAERATLRGARVLDIGCGGGLLSEALAKEGAQVTAIDLAPELVKVARLHGLESGVQVDYRVQAAEDLAAEQAGRKGPVAWLFRGYSRQETLDAGNGVILRDDHNPVEYLAARSVGTP